MLTHSTLRKDVSTESVFSLRTEKLLLTLYRHLRSCYNPMEGTMLAKFALSRGYVHRHIKSDSETCFKLLLDCMNIIEPISAQYIELGHLKGEFPCKTRTDETMSAFTIELNNFITHCPKQSILYGLLRNFITFHSGNYTSEIELLDIREFSVRYT